MSSIVLTTLNARYIHASLGLRYLYANMGELQSITTLQEFTINARAEDIAESLLARHPQIIGFGVYIWNATETLELMQLLRIIRPELILIAGGPEISYETEDQTMTAIADYVVTGAADLAFAELCQEILTDQAPQRKIVTSLPVALDQLKSPYPFYSDHDLEQRVVYVEASRGCPFKCEFCLSSLDKTATPFALEPFLEHLRQMIDRGARQFKFVDRTFNLKAETSRRILVFFLEQMGIRMEPTEPTETQTASPQRTLFLHFELIPDRLPKALMELLPLFPEGSLQFEIGIQSFNPEVQQRISRKQDHEKTCANLQWLRQQTTAHIHADLIAGLPGETIESFAKGFNLLHRLGPQEIQVGILKRLRGTPIDRHTQAFDMRYQASPPYRILSNDQIDFDTLQRIVRFARYWDLIANSGRFPHTLPLLLGQQPFERFMALSDWLYQTTGQTHRIALPKLLNTLHDYLAESEPALSLDVQQAIVQDGRHNGLKGLGLA